MTLIANLSDFQSGSTTALFPDRIWEGRHQYHKPTELQKQIHDHFLSCADLLARRGNRPLVIVNSGDAIDGVHHGTHQLVTRIIREQVDIHIELMEEFKERSRFNPITDKLIYVQGTETHTGEEEPAIAKRLNAEIADHIEILINNKRLWFVHEGVQSGKGPNKGNGLRNALRDIYYDCLEDGDPIPDLVSYAHVHEPIIGSFDGRAKTIMGYINPSWQLKTRFAYRVAPVVRTRIGMTVTEITEDGDIRRPFQHIMRFTSAKSIEL